MLKTGGETMKKFGLKWMEKLAAFALVIATIGANSACISIFHQDEFPETAKKLRRF